MTSSPHVRSLDLCRGLCAISVLFYHVDFLFFGKQFLFPRGYLCVDFFFILSGYVIARSYDTKLSRGFGISDFLAARVARLWPLVAASTLLGCAAQVARWHREAGALDSASILSTLFLNTLMLPSPASPTQFLFPFNGAAWSIFFEVAANVFYVLMVRPDAVRTLFALVATGGTALGGAALYAGSLDVGWSQANFIFGVPRVAFSFFLGVLMFRNEERLAHLSPEKPHYLLVGLAALMALLNVPLMHSKLDGVLDAVLVLIALPALLLVGLRANLGPRASLIAWFLGGISYSVYLLQTPLVILYSGLPQVLFKAKIMDLAPWGGFVFVPLVIAVSWMSWVYFEQPCQRFLRSLWMQSRGADVR